MTDRTDSPAEGIFSRGARALALVVLVLASGWTPRALASDEPDSANSAEKARVLEFEKLLADRKFEDLDAKANSLQAGYEAGRVSSVELLHGFRAFYGTNPKVTPLIDEWVRLFPRSYAARLARGIHYRVLAGEARGGKWISETSPEQVRAMEDYLDQALRDLQASEALAKKPILTYLHELTVGMIRGDRDSNRATLAKALAIDPKDFTIRRKYMSTITPRWGGSFGEMQDFLKASQKQGVTERDLHTLQAMIEIERGRASSDDRKPEDAVIHFKRAIDLEPERDQKTEALWLRLRAMQALHPGVDDVADADQLLKLSPNNAFALGVRGHARTAANDYPGALVDFRLAASLGDAYAQMMLGRLYWNGQGVTQDRAEAEDWFRRAANNGNEDAAKYLAGIAAEKKGAAR